MIPAKPCRSWQGFFFNMLSYGMVGAAAALTEWAVYASFLYLIGLNYLVSAVVAFVVATAVNYVLSLFYVFRGGRHTRIKEAALVYAVSLVGLAINVAVLYVFVEHYDSHPMLAKVLGTGCAFLWNYSARHVWVFHAASAET